MTWITCSDVPMGMDRDKGFCCGSRCTGTDYLLQYWLIRPHSVLSSICPIALLLSFSPQSLTLSDQSFLIIDRLFYCLDVRLSLRAWLLNLQTVQHYFTVFHAHYLRILLEQSLRDDGRRRIWIEYKQSPSLNSMTTIEQHDHNRTVWPQ